ncbi:hypothetical protein BBP40_008193 [Aspergillus hancockii]|nr:hypothetical protein BBP40_008193 [Aspergillus hancockii]
MDRRGFDRTDERELVNVARQVQLAASHKLRCSTQGHCVKWDNNAFLGALLLGFLESTADASGLRWNSLYEGTLRNHVWQRGPRGFSGSWEKSSLNIYWTCEGLRALSFDGDSQGIEWRRLEAERPPHNHTRLPHPQ